MNKFVAILPSSQEEGKAGLLAVPLPAAFTCLLAWPLACLLVCRLACLLACLSAWPLVCSLDLLTLPCLYEEGDQICYNLASLSGGR